MPKYARLGAIMLAAMMILFTGCSSGTANRKIGIVLPVGDDDFTKDAVRKAENKIQLLSSDRSFTYTLLKAETANEQANYVRAFIQETTAAINPQNDEDKKKTPYGMIVFWPMDEETLKPAAQSARDAGIPVFLFGQKIEGFTPTSSAVVDSDATAQMALSYIEKHAGGVSGIAAIDSGTHRTAFMTSFLNAAGDKAVAVASNPDPASDLRGAGRASIETLLRDNPGSVQAVFATDDLLALGVLDFVKANPGCGISVIASVGGTKALLDEMASAPVEMVTYAYSPNVIEVVMGFAADVSTGISILPEYRFIPTQIDKSYEKEYRQSDEYVARYG